MSSMYEWVNPWPAVERAERLERDWYDREEEHRLQMGVSARAFADATHMIRQECDAIMAPVLRHADIQSPAQIFLRDSATKRASKAESSEQLRVLGPYLKAALAYKRPEEVQQLMIQRFGVGRLTEIPVSRIPEAMEFFQAIQ